MFIMFYKRFYMIEKCYFDTEYTLKRYTNPSSKFHRKKVRKRNNQKNSKKQYHCSSLK